LSFSADILAFAWGIFQEQRLFEEQNSWIRCVARVELFIHNLVCWCVRCGVIGNAVSGFPEWFTGSRISVGAPFSTGEYSAGFCC